MKQLLVRCFAALGLLLFTVSVIPPAWYAGFLARPWTEPSGKVMIVLGADTLSDGSLGISSLWRCTVAVELWRGGGFEHVIVSGDKNNVAAMRDYLTARGIPAAAILLEPDSESTRANALNTARIAKGLQGPFVMLTSDFHLWRARRAFAKAGFEVGARPCPDLFKRSLDWRNRWHVFWELMEEFSKIGYYKARGWA